MKIYYLNSNNLNDPQLDKLLQSAEEHRQIRCNSTSDLLSKRECIAADALIKHGVRDYLSDKSIQPHTRYLTTGKLVLENIPLQLCISHTQGHVFLVIHESNIGIDAECIRNLDYQKLYNRFFKNSSDQPQSSIDFLKQWTTLEARFKLENKSYIKADYEYTAPVVSFLYKNFVVSVACSDTDFDTTKASYPIYELNSEEL